MQQTGGFSATVSVGNNGSRPIVPLRRISPEKPRHTGQQVGCISHTESCPLGWRWLRAEDITTVASGPACIRR
ncbi:MAG: hypothetical protein LUF85_15400 [Bacteroides sp.]|nr:hypothetical protein [Bacteroides sp.]